MKNIASSFCAEMVLHEMARDSGLLVFNSYMSKIQFYDFVTFHNKMKIERDKEGVVTIHEPIGLDDGHWAGIPFTFLKEWSRVNKFGEAFFMSVGYDLPTGAFLRANSSWIPNKKLQKLSKEDRKKIASIVPDFVIEVRSETDRISKLKTKMTEGWIANGVELAWLIDPQNEEVYIYRKNKKTEKIKGFGNKLSGEKTLPGFEFNLSEMKA